MFVFWNSNVLEQNRTERNRTHQNLEEHHDELVAGHEVAVQHPEVKPAAQAAEHLYQHLFITARLLQTRHLRAIAAMMRAFSNKHASPFVKNRTLTQREFRLYHQKLYICFGRTSLGGE